MNRRNTVRKSSSKKHSTFRKRKNHLKYIAFALPCIAVLLIVFSSFADAHNTKEKYYTSIMVESGDTLWSLANEYSSVEYRDNNAYIKEVRELNHITSDDIHAGSYLILPYYE